jgi:Tfp pilus assembly protein PilX
MVLLVSLFILATLTLLGLAAYQNTIVQESMAGNFRFHAIATQSAEAALRVGERWLACRQVLPEPVPQGNLPAAPTITPNADALLVGEVWGADLGVSAVVDVDEPWWFRNSPVAWNSIWTDADLAGALDYSASGVAVPPPRYAIESLGGASNGPVGSLVYRTERYGRKGGGWGKDSHYFQITSVGTDSTGRSRVLLRSTYQCRNG